MFEFSRRTHDYAMDFREFTTHGIVNFSNSLKDKKGFNFRGFLMLYVFKFHFYAKDFIIENLTVSKMPNFFLDFIFQTPGLLTW